VNVHEISARLLTNEQKQLKSYAAKVRVWYSTLFTGLILPLVISSCLRELNRSQDGVSEIQEPSLTVKHAVPKSRFQQWQYRWNCHMNMVGSIQQ
jgi:hypothetical protein